MTQSTTADALDVVMHAVLTSMSEMDDQTTEEFDKLNDQLVKLYKMKEIENTYELKNEELILQSANAETARQQKERDQDLENEKLRQSQQDLDNFDRVSRTTIVAAAVNIAGIVAILKHEQLNVITTKALGFVGKMIK